jgi:protein-disulfide isomerase
MIARLENLATAAVIAAAAAVAVAVVHREFFDAKTAGTRNPAGPPTFVEDWKTLANKGIRRGDTGAPVQIVEFSDFECPVCKRFHESFTVVERTHANQVSLVFLHFPLPQHRFARSAARAAECAAKSGRFAEFEDVVFAKQDSLGLKSWASYARDAAILDTSAFLKSASDTARVARIEEGIALGKKFGVNGTPTVLINGWRFSFLAPDSLSRIVERVASGKAPLPSMERR